MGHGLDDLIFGAKKYVDIAGEKAGAAVEYSKKQIERAQLKAQLKEKFSDLGKLCYEMHEKDEDYTGSMKKIIEEIKKTEEQIKEAEEALNVPKVCPLCGAKNNGESDYCSACGEKLER